MTPRCRSVYQNYEGFQAWDEIPEQSHWNLLTKLNSNLSNYESKYKKYMNVKENQIKEILRNQGNQNRDVPFLPHIKNQNKPVSLLNSQQMNRVKVIQQESDLRDSQIFCQRSHNHLKLKTISFEKQKRKKMPFQRRKFSLNQHNQLNIQKFFNKQNQQIDVHVHDNPNKLSKLKSMECRQLKYRFKKAAKKAKQFQQGWQNKVKQNLENMNLKRQIKQSLGIRRAKNLSSITEQVQRERTDFKSNEFSDKKFYQEFTRLKFPIRRQIHSKLEQEFPRNKYKLGR